MRPWFRSFGEATRRADSESIGRSGNAGHSGPALPRLQNYGRKDLVHMFE
jgi:hypothetical protein